MEVKVSKFGPSDRRLARGSGRGRKGRGGLLLMKNKIRSPRASTTATITVTVALWSETKYYFLFDLLLRCFINDWKAAACATSARAVVETLVSYTALLAAWLFWLLLWRSPLSRGTSLPVLMVVRATVYEGLRILWRSNQ